MTTLTLPELAPGETYAGLILKEDGTPSHHLILLEGRDNKRLTWAQAKEAAAAAGGELPTRQEQALLYANCKQHFQAEWYWSGEEQSSEPGWAWLQHFYNGGQTTNRKATELLARAVRRLVISD